MPSRTLRLLGSWTEDFLRKQRNRRCKCQFLTWVKVRNVRLSGLANSIILEGEISFFARWRFCKNILDTTLFSSVNFHISCFYAFWSLLETIQHMAANFDKKQDVWGTVPGFLHSINWENNRVICQSFMALTLIYLNSWTLQYYIEYEHLKHSWTYHQLHLNDF